MQDWIKTVIEKWTAEGVKLNPAATIEEIEEAELVLNFKFPDDFKEFYLKVDAFEKYEWQEHMFSFWSLQRIIEEYNEFGETDFIGFCDFLICSHFVGFVRGKSGVFKNYLSFQAGEFELIAPAFEEVVRMINKSSDSIY